VNDHSIDTLSDHLGPRLARKPLQMIWMLDVSGSMSVGGKIEALNYAMSEAITSVRDAALEIPGVQIYGRVITFAHDAAWHVATPTKIEELAWNGVAVVERGTTEMGAAIGLAAEAVRDASRVGRGVPPALVLVSDGKPTDLRAPSFGASLRRLAEDPWGRSASRVAIGIGADADMDVLRRFIGHDEIEPLRADNADELRNYLRWASTVVVDERTRPATHWVDGSPSLAPSDSATPTAAVIDVEDDDTTVTVPRPAEPTSIIDDTRLSPPRKAPPAGPARRNIPPPPDASPTPVAAAGAPESLLLDDNETVW
jgi:uncharacterized protein YegL